MFYTGNNRLALGSLLLFTAFSAVGIGAENRISQPVEDSKRVSLAGNVTPQVKYAADQGRVDASLQLPYVSLMLKPSASQQSALNQLLARQQDPASPDYHHWLSPDEFGIRFGASQADIDKLVNWLTAHGLQVKAVARDHDSVAFAGQAGQIESAFGIEIHHFKVGDELHYANTSAPTVPAAFEGLVGSVHGLHDFRMKPKLRPSSVRRIQEPRDNIDGQHQIAPDDVATIYDVTPFYNAGINGAGQKIVVAGQTRLPLSDIASYRSAFSLPANVPTTMLVPGTQDPGISQDDLAEADLDVELSGAVARNATIIFVYSENVSDSFQYAIQEDLAPVLSMSYGACELQTGLADALQQQALVLQANAQGMTVIGPSGDNVSLDCAGDGNAPGSFPDEDSLSVDAPASIPQVTAVGGTEFNEGNGNYWNRSNSATQASALSYIPEVVWNDSAIDGTPSGSGGGASVYFDKPWWQAGAGVPADGVRDVPDIALTASGDHDGFVIYSDGAEIVGGTSVTVPTFAGMVVLIGQYEAAGGFQTGAALGQINPVLYSLASVPGVFHDITLGTNAVPACDQQDRCTLPSIGYAAAAGYDQATGLGSVDAFNLAKAWHAATLNKLQTSATVSASQASLAFTGTTVLTATVSGAGSAPTGEVKFSVANSLLGSASLSGGGEASLPVSGTLLAEGGNTISAQYQGDSTHSGAAAYVNVTVSSPASGNMVIGGVSNAASFTGVFAPGGIISIFGTQLAPATAISTAPLPALLTGTSVTIQGIAAPLYFASPTQLNVQVPYGIPPASTPAVTVYNGDQTASATLQLSAAAPAIFTFNGGAPVPYTSAAAGQEAFLFITGAGALTPAVATGMTPVAGTAISALPVPAGAVSVTVGGVNAPVNFVGVPTWSVGAVQINYTVPAGVAAGTQPVIVSVDGIQSAAAMLVVTN